MVSSSAPRPRPVVLGDLNALASWRRGPAAVAAVPLRVDGQVILEVDAALCDRLLAVTAPRGEIDALSGIFGAAGQQAWRTYLDSGDSAQLEALRLPPQWARRFEVEAVLTVRPTPMGRGPLVLDEVLASSGVDDPIAAARLLTFGSETLSELVDDLLDGALPECVVVEIEDALRRAAPLATSTMKYRLEDDLAALDARRSFDDLDLEIFRTLLTVSAPAETRGLAVHAGDGAGHASGAHYPVDPFTVSPRMVRWSGAGHDEVYVITEAAAAGQQAYTPGAAMRSRVYVEVHDVDEAVESLRAFVADRATGQLLKVESMKVAELLPEELGTVQHSKSGGGWLVADVEYSYPDSRDGVETSLQFGVIAVGGSFPSVRADKVGSQLVKVDRLAVDAWHCRRQAVTAEHLAQRLRQVQDKAEELAGTLDDRARSLTKQADADTRQIDRALSALKRSLTNSSRRGAERLAGEAEHRRQMWSKLSEQAPQPVPLLAELEALLREVA